MIFAAIFFLAVLSAIAAKQIFGLFTEVDSISFVTGDVQAPPTWYYLVTLKWSIEGQNFSAGDTFSLSLKCMNFIGLFQLMVGTTVYATCQVNSRIYNGGYSQLDCTLTSSVTKDTYSIGAIEIPVFFGAGGTGHDPTDFACASEYSPGVNTISFNDGQNKISNKVEFSSGLDSSLYSMLVQYSLPLTIPSMFYVLGESDCAWGTASSTLSATISGSGAAFDCLQLFSSVSNNFNSWNAPIDLLEKQGSVSCSSTSITVTYYRPNGRPYFNVPVIASLGFEVHYTNTNACYWWLFSPAKDNDVLWKFHENPSVLGVGTAFVTETVTYTETVNLLTTLSGIYTETVLEYVPVPTSSLTQSWTNSFPSIQTKRAAPGETAQVIYEVPYSWTTQAWTGKFTEYITSDGTIFINEPEPTSTWSGSFTTTFAINDRLGHVQSVVAVPTPTTTSTWTGSGTSTIIRNGTIVIEVPTPTTTSTWTGSETSTIVRNGTIVIEIPTPTTTSTWTGSGASTIIRNGTIVIEVPTPTTTSTWTGSDTSTIVRNGTIVIEIPTPTTISTWTESETSTTSRNGTKVTRIQPSTAQYTWSILPESTMKYSGSMMTKSQIFTNSTWTRSYQATMLNKETVVVKGATPTVSTTAHFQESAITNNETFVMKAQTPIVNSTRIRPHESTITNHETIEMETLIPVTDHIWTSSQDFTTLNTGTVFINATAFSTTFNRTGPVVSVMSKETISTQVIASKTNSSWAESLETSISKSGTRSVRASRDSTENICETCFLSTVGPATTISISADNFEHANKSNLHTITGLSHFSSLVATKSEVSRESHLTYILTYSTESLSQGEKKSWKSNINYNLSSLFFGNEISIQTFAPLQSSTDQSAKKDSYEITSLHNLSPVTLVTSSTAFFTGPATTTLPFVSLSPFSLNHTTYVFVGDPVYFLEDPVSTIFDNTVQSTSFLTPLLPRLSTGSLPLITINTMKEWIDVGVSHEASSSANIATELPDTSESITKESSNSQSFSTKIILSAGTNGTKFKPSFKIGFVESSTPSDVTTWYVQQNANNKVDFVSNTIPNATSYSNKSLISKSSYFQSATITDDPANMSGFETLGISYEDPDKSPSNLINSGSILLWTSWKGLNNMTTPHVHSYGSYAVRNTQTFILLFIMSTIHLLI